MISFSAANAISPAIERTKWFLFRPFNFWTFLKLSLVAMLTEGGSSGSFPSGNSGNHAATPFSFPTITPAMIGVIAIGSIFVIALCLYLVYLITRLRFAFFHCLIHNIQEIGPGWGLYRAQATRMFWFQVIFGLVFMLAFGLLALPFVFAFLHHGIAAPGGPQQFGAIAGLVFLALIAFVVVFVVSIAANTIINDFMLPHIALDDASIREAWEDSYDRFSVEKGSFIFYIFLKAVLRVVTALGAVMLAAIPILIVGFVFVGIGVGLHAGGAAMMTQVAIDSVLVIAGVAFFLIVIIAVSGPFAVWSRNYALMFYGGRYQALGEILMPSAPFQPPPPPDPLQFQEPASGVS